MEQQVSMLRASFLLLLQVVEQVPPSRIVLRGQGEDRRIGSSLQIESEITLTEDGNDTTRMAYRHNVSVFGRLGAIGFPIIQRKAKEAEAEFARRAVRRLNEEA